MMPYHRAINGGWCGTVNELLKAVERPCNAKVKQRWNKAQG